MAGFHGNLWAPWRMEYIRSLQEESGAVGCFFCAYWADPAGDEANLVVWRERHCFVVMNRFPYTGGHLLVATTAHEGDPLRLSEEENAELTRTTWQAVALLRRTLQPEGFNVGSNLGHGAGAGVPDHYHCHVVPRWSGDTNYMSVLGDVRVIPESLGTLYAQLVQNAVEMGLGKAPPASR
jgi:ATP adenylyltransferase